MFKKTRKYYADYLSFVVKYCQNKGLDYATEVETGRGYIYSITIKEVGLYRHFRIKMKVL